MAEVTAGTARARRPGRPAQLSRERILDAVSAAEDLDALTMRDLAGRLGVSHGALYRWVRNREELFDLISEVLVERITERLATAGPGPREQLAELAWAMHDHFLAVPGYAGHLARPHRHHAHSLGRVRSVVLAALADAGTGAELADQHWYVFVTGTVGWLAAAETPRHLTQAAPRFEVFLEILLRGLLPQAETVDGR